MGQYYLAVILAEKTDNKETIRLAMDPTDYANGMKLREHSYVGNEFIMVMEFLLSQNGMFYKSRSSV